MPKFIFAYHGGNAPATMEEQQKVMAAWGAWMGSHESAWADPGAPVGENATVTAGGVENHGGANPLSGYSLIEADSLAAAIEIAKGCPIIDDGGSVEVASVHQM